MIKKKKRRMNIYFELSIIPPKGFFCQVKMEN